MIKHRKYYYTFVMSVMLLAAEAQEGNSFSLQQAIEYAVKYSPSYLNADLDQQSAEYRRREIAGMGYPQIDASIDIKNYIEIPTSLIPGDFVGMPPGTFIPVKFGTRYQGTAGFSASQLVFSSDYIFALKASKEFMNLSRINLLRSKSELVSQVSKAYYGVLINRDRVVLLDANLTRLKKLYDDTKATNEQGFTEQIDVERLEVNYNNLKTEKENALKLIGVLETQLKFQMGYDLGKAIVLSDSLDADISGFSELSTANIDVSARPEYMALQANQKLMDLNLRSKQWGYLPTLVAYGSYQYNSQRNQFDFFTQDKSDPTKQWFKIALIGATLKVNIFDGFQRHNQIQQARIVAMKNRNDLLQLQLGAGLEATMASITYSNAHSTLLMQKRNLELAQHVVEVAQKKYEAGVGSNIEVVTAETSLKEAQTNYFNAVYNMIVSKIEYQRATGTLVK